MQLFAQDGHAAPSVGPGDCSGDPAIPPPMVPSVQTTHTTRLASRSAASSTTRPWLKQLFVWLIQLVADPVLSQNGYGKEPLHPKKCPDSSYSRLFHSTLKVDPFNSESRIFNYES